MVRISRSLALGAAGSVMITGGAMAVDLPPIEFVAAAPPPPVAATGPEIKVDVINMAQFGYFFGANFGSSTYFNIDVKSVSDWGFAVVGGTGVGTSIAGPIVFGTNFFYRLYRSIGDFEVGVGGVGSGGCGGPLPLSCGGAYRFNANLFYDYESDRLSVRSENYVFFFPGFQFYSNTDIEFHVTDSLRAVGGLEFNGFGDWYFGAEFDVNEQIEIWGELYVDDNGFDRVAVGAELDLGVIDPYVGVRWSGPGIWISWIGADFEKQLGTGRFLLVANAELGYSSCCGGTFFEAGFGIRYTMGDHSFGSSYLYRDDYRRSDPFDD